MDIANRKPTRLAIDLLAPQPGERILDAGCGSGQGMAEMLRRARCEVIGVDRSSAMVAAAGRRLGRAAKLFNVDIEGMPFAEQSFDAVLAVNVLYFCDPQYQMVRALRDVLRPGGRLVAYVTDGQTMENWSFARKGLHRLFSEKTLAGAMLAGGFAGDAISVRAQPLTPSVTGLFALARC